MNIDFHVQMQLLHPKIDFYWLGPVRVEDGTCWKGLTCRLGAERGPHHVVLKKTSETCETS